MPESAILARPVVVAQLADMSMALSDTPTAIPPRPCRHQILRPLGRPVTLAVITGPREHRGPFTVRPGRV
jgi:hypothetical protein